MGISELDSDIRFHNTIEVIDAGPGVTAHWLTGRTEVAIYDRIIGGVKADVLLIDGFSSAKRYLEVLIER